MPLMNLSNLVGRMPVSRSDLAQVFPRHAIQTIDGVRVFAGGHQRFIKGGPLIAPVEVETNALAQLIFVDLAPPPFVEDVLMARENRFDSEHDRPVARLGAVFEQTGSKTLRRRKRVIIANQKYVGCSDHRG